MHQKYWTIVFYCAAAFVCLGWVGVNKFRQEASKIPQGITLTKYSDMLDLIPYLALYILLRQGFNFLFEESVFRRVKETDPINYSTKQHKVLKEAFCVFWYSFTSIYGFALFWGTDLLPKLCFGTLGCT